MPTLDPQRWELTQEVLRSALDEPPETRAEFVERAAAGDETVRGIVMSLLDAFTKAGAAQAGGVDREDARQRLAAAIADRYTIEHQIGVGGMATVYRAADRKHNRKVAIKVLRPELAATLGKERFLREIEIIAGMQHPHILPLFDSGAEDGVLYYVMPYVEGDTLWDRLAKERTLPVDDSVQIVVDLLSALEYAHKRGIVHRDIKPANILISASGGHAVVADFGIAHAVSAAEQNALTLPGVLVGTPGYMAPEQIGGAGVSPAMDIYAAGVVLFECLTGRVWDPTAREGDWTGVPLNLQPVLQRALRSDPRSRWRDAAAFRKALRDLPSGTRRVRRRAAVTVSAAVVLAAMVVGGWFLSDGASTPAVSSVGTRVAVLPFSVRGSDELDYLGDGIVDLLSTKLDGAGNLRSIDPRAVFSVIAREAPGNVVDPALGQRIADALDADLYVLGNIIEVEGRVLLDASMYRDGVEVEGTLQAAVEGDATEVLALLDELAAELLVGQPDARDARLTQLALVTTGSLPALKSYLRGVGDLRMARYATAAGAFRDAVNADSTFALAWYQLSVTADWLLRADLAREAADRAVQFSGRMPERDRRLLEALQTVRRGDAAQAERMYRAILGNHPNDVEGWSQLGELLFHFGPRLGKKLAESRSAWERLASLEPDRATAFVHLARLEASERDLTALDSMAQHVIALSPDGDRVAEMAMLRAFTRDDAAERERAIGRIRDLNDDLLAEVVWSSGAYVGDPIGSMSLVELMTEPSRSLESRSLGYGWLAALELAQGKLEGAYEQLRRMEALDSLAALEHRSLMSVAHFVDVDPSTIEAQRERLSSVNIATVRPSAAEGVWFTVHDGLHDIIRTFLDGLLHAHLGSDRAALGTSSKLLGMTPPDGAGSIVEDMATVVRAMVAWQAGRVDDALTELDLMKMNVWHQFAVASPFFAQVHGRYLRAMALEASGRLEEALRWYGSFNDASVYDLMYLAPSHWRRGRIYEALGELDLARHHYQRFLELWRDADSAFESDLNDARQALDRIGASR